jgi:hypothetical protein
MGPDRNSDTAGAAAGESEREGRRVLSTTDARQGSPRKANLRVLVVSLVVLAAVGLALTVAYWGTAVEDHATVPGNAPQSGVSDPARQAPVSMPEPQTPPQTQP